MPFTFKLSMRLALMKAWLARSAAAVFAAWGLQDWRVTALIPPDSAVVPTLPSLENVMLDPHQERQLLAFDRTRLAPLGVPGGSQ